MHRRFRVSNFQSTTKVRPFCTTMPIGLSSGWNQVQFNLADFTRRAYGTTFIETMRVQVHANIRIRRIYFADRLYGDDEMPNEYRLFLPIPGTHRRQSVPQKPSKDEKRPSKESAEKEAPSVAPPGTPIPEEKGDAAAAKTEAAAPAHKEGEAPGEGEGEEEEEGEAEGEAEGPSEAHAEAGTEEPPTTEGGDESPAEEGAATEVEAAAEAPDTSIATEA